MLPPPMIRDWASKLISSEADLDLTSTQTELATLRVYEKIRRQFCGPIGADAFQALASRALSLVKSQFPRIGAVNITANGGLHGFDEVEAPLNTGEDGEVGIVLIAQLLGLLVTLLGEAATLRLIEGAPLQIEVKAELDKTGASDFVGTTSCLGAFERILVEAEQLRSVSERLEMLADTHAGIDELIGVAGNIRNIATVLDVFTLIRSEAGGSEDRIPTTNGYLN